LNASMSLWPTKNWNTRTGVAVFLLAAGLSVCIFQLASRSRAASTPDSHANPVANSTKVAITSPAVPAGGTYTWKQTFNTDWQVPANWSPVRLTPDPADIIVFDSSTPSATVTNVPSQTIAQLNVIGGASATLNAATIPAGDKALTISGGSLNVPAGTFLTLAGSTVLTISITSGSTGTIGGLIILQNAAHKVLAGDANGITFQNGSIFTTSTGFTGNPFGAGTDGSVVFQNGSASFFNAGGDPFGGPGHSIATFTLGSSQTFNTPTAFLSDGRTYGNLTLDGSQSYAGSGTGLLTVFNTLTIASGSTLTLSSSSGGDLNLLGDITINGTFNANGRTVKFQGGGLFGGDTQNINTAATFGDVIISKIAGSVKLSGVLTINGALQFNGSSSAVDVVDLNGNVLNLNGTVGGNSSSAANGFKGSLGSTLNIGGAGALGTLRFISGAQNLASLSINRTSSGSVTLGSNLTVGNASTGSLTLTNGVVDVGSNTLSLASFPSIFRTNGYVIGNLQKTFGATGSFTFTVGTANGYSPLDANVTAGVGNSLTVKAIQGKHPAFTGANALLRYWTLSNSGSVTANLTFHYLGADVAGVEPNYKVFKYDGSFTKPPGQSVNTAAHTATVNGVSSFSDWTLDNLPTLSIDNVSINEGSVTGTTDFTFTVTKTGTTALTATVNFATAPGTTNPATSGASCAAGIDFQSQSSSLTFLPADTTKTITVLVCQDAVFEADETFFVNLSGETNATLTQNQGRGTIQNDDSPGPPLVVNTTDDHVVGPCDTLPSGDCTLREAITAINGSLSPVGLNFAIPAGDPRHFYYSNDGVVGQVTNDGSHVFQTSAVDDTTIGGIDPDWPHSWWSILPTSAVPTVTQTVVIDGYTQTGATVNTLATSDNAVLRIELDGTSAGVSVTGLTLSGATSVLRGLVINRFNGGGISLQGSGSSSLTGNFIGADVSGILGLGNNASGVSCTANSMTIGGSAPARANLISGNAGVGILITNSNSNLIQGNFIGTKADGISSLSNTASGINFTGSNSTSNTVGGTNVGAGNTIAFNGADGVRLADAGTGNITRGNSIFSNGSTASDLGIDLGADGVTANDGMDPDIGPNNLQNFPLMTRAVTGATNIIQGTLNSTPGQTFTIDFYANVSCDTSGNGEGKTYLGTVVTPATDGTTGDVSFTFNPGSLSAGQVITATATDSSGNTSEFSACLTVVAGVPGTIQFAAANTNDTETNSGSHPVNIAVTRSGGDGAVSVNYAVTDGTATAGSDYSSSPSAGTLTWVDQDTSTKFITITVNGDTTVELNETVNLTLSSATGGASIVGTNPATLTIVNDDCLTSLTVNNNGDAGDASPGDGVCETASESGICTLRAALQEVNASPSSCATIDINFSGVVSPIILGAALPDINRSVRLNGPGASQLTISGNNASRVFNIQSGVTVTIADLTIANGKVTGGNSGGNILNNGALTLTNCNIYGGSTTNSGGGIFSAGPSLTLTDCNVGGTAAGQANSAFIYGGIWSSAGTLTMTGGSISGNSSGGINVAGGTANLSNVAITNNSFASASGGGIGISGGAANITNCLIANNSANAGAGIAITSGSGTIVNSTISTNNPSTCGTGGGISMAGGTLTLTNVTITKNRAGGIRRTGGTITLSNTIVAGNLDCSPSTNPNDISGTVDASSSFNLIGTGGAGGLSNGVNNNQVGVTDARLAPLGGNGGPTQTHAFLSGSPALDAGSNTLATNAALTTDQRGSGFARVVDGPDADTTATVDIGAFEAQVSVEDITDKATNEDTQLQFTFNVGGASIDSVTATSGNPALVPNNPANIAVTGSGSTRTLTITPAANQFGTSTITVTVNGANSQTMTDTFVLSVGAVADTPSVTDATTNEDTQTTSGLVVSRNAADGAEVTHFKITGITNGTLFKNNGTTQINNGDFITFAEGNAGLKFTPAANLFSPGTTFGFQVQGATSAAGAGLSSGFATATLTVTPIADTPSASNATTNEDTQTNSGLVITRNAADGAEVTHFKITGITNGTLFQNNGTTQINSGDFITFAQGNSGLKFTPAANLFSPSTTFSFQVQGATSAAGAGLSSGFATATITVNPVADTPSVTNATTNEDTQTTSGLVITRNAADGAEVTQFKITGITNGTLFQNNGTTPINNNDFITVAQGNTGLKFTPAANLFSPATTFSFQAQASLNNTNAGLGGSLATATITVNPIADTPTVTNATTSINTQTTSGLVISRNAADSTEVTHFQITNIQNGTLFKNNGTTPINNNDFITVAEGNAGLKFTPANNLASPASTFSFQVQASTSNSNAGLGGSTVTATITVNGSVVRFSSGIFSTTESSFAATITVERLGDLTSTVTVNYATPDDSAAPPPILPCSTAGLVSSRCDFTTAIGTLTFAPGDTSKTFTVLISQDNYVEGSESVPLTLSNVSSNAVLGSPSTATLTIADDAVEPVPNPIDDASNFVRQHYHDFLNREPDAGGLAFWTSQITSCGTNRTCIDARRVDVSAAFFLSIEFQNTGYLVERLYKASYGDATGTSTIGGTHQLSVPIVRFSEFLPDTQKIGQGLIVGQTGWETVLENSKQAFVAEFVQRARFTTAYANTLTPAQFVNLLFVNAGVTPTPTERQAAIDEFGGAATSANASARGRALRRVAENGTLQQQEFNRALVLMQYFGYLRRNPNAAPDSDYSGYDFWLTKLNQFTQPGDDPIVRIRKADMVKAFINSTEYQTRFGFVFSISRF
jgi:CSLREA domain-containing protein